MNSISFACPNCQQPFPPHSCRACSHCKQTFNHQDAWLDLCITQDPINVKTEAAYKVYSRFYVPVAFLAYCLVWRGRILKHIAFFRDLLRHHSSILDIATGDGSLTRAALLGSKKLRASQLCVIDLSSEMLLKANRTLRGVPVTLVRGDVCQLPLPSDSVIAMSCFGGFNSFPSGQVALKEIKRCLAKNGVLRGSVLLLPKTPWRKKLVQKWIDKGYQTEEVTKETFLSWVKHSDLQLTVMEQYGDVLLFELRKSGV